MRFVAIALAVLLVGCQSESPEPEVPQVTVAAKDSVPTSVTFSRASGGTMKIRLGSTSFNSKSTVDRVWITAHDAECPIDLDGTVGVTPKWHSERFDMGLRLDANIPVSVREDITAFEVRFILFDIWGQFTSTLSKTEITDMAAGDSEMITDFWDPGLSAISEYYASIAYVARVRTKSGRVYETEQSPILDEARRFQADFEPDWLDAGSEAKDN